MTNANALPYYPRFIFSCSDGNCFSTADLEQLKHIKDAGSEYDVSSFVPGRKINISWVNDAGQQEIKVYKVDKIEIHQIKYDLDEPTYGMNSNDCSAVFGKEKKWLMEIYVFLENVN